MKRSPIRARRATPRRRDAPRFDPIDWTAATLTLLARQNSTCWWCEKPLGEDGARHHRQRRRDGGDRLSNLVILHSGCHNLQPGSVHQEPALAMELGFIVPSYGDPLGVPVIVRGQAWMLDDLGGREPTGHRGVAVQVDGNGL